MKKVPIFEDLTAWEKARKLTIEAPQIISGLHSAVNKLKDKQQ